MTDDTTISPDHEDAFAALFPVDVAQLRRARAHAMRHLRAELQAMPGTQQQIADQLDIKQPRLNKILRGEADAISLDNLVQLAARIGLRAEVVFSKPTELPGSGFEEAIAQADRHCDMEGLPTASERALELDRQLIAGEVTPDQAIETLVAHHTRVDGVPEV